MHNKSSTFTPVSFTSDNIAGASDAIIKSIAENSTHSVLPYGNDELTHNVTTQLKEIFETDLDVFLVPTGTAANALSLAALTPAWGSVLCHPKSHINNDECGAPEFFSAGSKLITVSGGQCKIDADILRVAAMNKRGDVHTVQPSAVSITQATENGSCYTLDEIQHIGDICRSAGLGYHMDGARFANALVASAYSPAEMTWKASVDVLSFGATKNGTLGVDAIVLFNKKLADEIAFRRKRAGHLMSKMRLLSCQMSAYLEDDLWLNNASHANEMAKLISDGLQKNPLVELVSETETNIIFCKMQEELISHLLDNGLQFYHDRWEQGVVRLVTNFSTQKEQVDYLLKKAAEFTGNVSTAV
ncbi:threonine aldolase family protein [Vibrio sp. SCSIO 43137]|uniref:threonine aldolase family protein n=1 Tax=Vibrio sp. SCSIO 43137 TaxID=3021011 RepID=UPI002307A171|nr:low specificity L-threonine aldolase [Vibrio sp. SCSIO 43137]WCE32330.1 low specificity L-threonine aldolase [Vibrio sp. SCSIO 43137]